jgi:hypothetical protein
MRPMPGMIGLVSSNFKVLILHTCYDPLHMPLTFSYIKYLAVWKFYTVVRMLNFISWL